MQPLFPDAFRTQTLKVTCGAGEVGAQLTTKICYRTCHVIVLGRVSDPRRSASLHNQGNLYDPLNCYTMAALPSSHVESRLSSNAAPRRAAFADVHRHNQYPQPPSQHHPITPRAAEKSKESEMPRLTRQNTKTTPPSPPVIIRDVGRSVAFTRVGFLGEVCASFSHHILDVYLL